MCSAPGDNGIPQAQQIAPGSIYQYQNPGYADLAAGGGVAQLGNQNVAQNFLPDVNASLNSALNNNGANQNQTGDAGNNSFNLSNAFFNKAPQNQAGMGLYQELTNSYFDPNNQQLGNTNTMSQAAYNMGGKTQDLGNFTAAMGPSFQNYANSLSNTVPTFQSLGNQVGATAPTFQQAGQGVMNNAQAVNNTAPTFQQAGQNVMNSAAGFNQLGSQVGASSGQFQNQAGAAFSEAHNTDVLADSTAKTASSFYGAGKDLMGRANPLYASGDNAASYAQQALTQGFDPQQDYYRQQQQLNTDQTRATLAAQGLGTSAYGSQVENNSNQNFNIAFGHDQLAREAQGAATASGLYGTQANMYGAGAGQIGAGLNAYAGGNQALGEASNMLGQADQARQTGAGFMGMNNQALQAQAGLNQMGNQAVGEGAQIYGLGNQALQTGASMTGQGANIFNMGNQALQAQGDLYNMGNNATTQAGQQMNNAISANGAAAGLYGQAANLNQMGVGLGQSIPRQQMAALQAYTGAQNSNAANQINYANAGSYMGQQGASLSQNPFNFAQQQFQGAGNLGLIANQTTQQQVSDFLQYLQQSTGANAQLINAANANNSSALVSAQAQNQQNNSFLNMLGSLGKTAASAFTG